MRKAPIRACSRPCGSPAQVAPASSGASASCRRAGARAYRKASSTCPGPARRIRCSARSAMSSCAARRQTPMPATVISTPPRASPCWQPPLYLGRTARGAAAGARADLQHGRARGCPPAQGRLHLLPAIAGPAAQHLPLRQGRHQPPAHAAPSQRSAGWRHHQRQLHHRLPEEPHLSAPQQSRHPGALCPPRQDAGFCRCGHRQRAQHAFRQAAYGRVRRQAGPAGGRRGRRHDPGRRRPRRLRPHVLHPGLRCPGHPVGDAHQ